METRFAIPLEILRQFSWKFLWNVSAIAFIRIPLETDMPITFSNPSDYSFEDSKSFVNSFLSKFENPSAISIGKF